MKEILFKMKRKVFPKKIAFIDGDQNLGPLINCCENHLKNTNTEIKFIRLFSTDAKEPKILKDIDWMDKIYLEGFAAKKEVVDKYIAGCLHKCISEGYTEITIVSSDYDFIDIFKMAILINDAASKVDLRLIAPAAKGKLAIIPGAIMNIQVIRD